MSRVSVFWGLLLGLATHAQAQAQDGPAPVNTSASLSARPDDDAFVGGQIARASNTELTGREHPAGTYTGVVPGAGTPAVPVRAGTNPATITWPGFQMRPDGSSRVFVQSTTPLSALPQPSAAGKYVVLLPKARVSGGTNKLPLDTRYFNTPVTRVTVNVSRAGTQLTLELRADVTPQISNEHASSGFYFTYIDLPKGTYVATPDKPKAVASAAHEGSAPANAPNQPTTQLDDDSGARARAEAEASLHAADDELPPAVHGRATSRIKIGK